MFWNRYEALCVERDIATNGKEMRGVLGLKSTGTISGWKTKGYIPSDDMLAQVAAYFGVSVPYLLGYTDDRYPPNKEAPAEAGEVSAEDAEILKATAGLSNEAKLKVLDYMNYLLHQQSKEGE